MPIERFPDPRDATEDGILAFGGDLHPESLILAYGQGIFPWPIQNLPLAWFCPDPRAILEFSDLHIPRSLAQALRRAQEHSETRPPLRMTIDAAFDHVIRECSKVPRPGQPGTWITPDMLRAYRELHRLGHAHSAEVWLGEKLVGGIYGVDSGGAFAGESMFHLVPNASKFALLHLIEHLKSRGLHWLDIQVMTPHLKALGAKEISRDDFLKKLSQTRARFSGWKRALF